MPKYYVYSKEMVFYCTEVEANSIEEAMQKIENREVEVNPEDIIDGENFEIIDVELVK